MRSLDTYQTQLAEGESLIPEIAAARVIVAIFD